jgi:hypothetical protein
MDLKSVVTNVSLKRMLHSQQIVKSRMPKEDVNLVISVSIIKNAWTIVQIIIGMDGG